MTGDEKPKQRVVTAEEVAEKERQIIERKREELRAADPFAFAVATKKGAHVINGGNKKSQAKALAALYDRFKRKQKKRNPRFKMGRVTAPKKPRSPETE